MTLTAKLFSFQGRLRRRDYWLLNIGLTVLMFVLIMVLGLLFGADFGNDDDIGYLLAQFLGGVVIIWPALAVAVKRCHDRNQTGWLYLIVLIPLIGGLWALINLGILDGTPGVNKYGSSPKSDGADEAEVFA